MSVLKKFKVGDRVELTRDGPSTRRGQKGTVDQINLMTGATPKKNFWWYGVRLDKPLPGSAPSYMFRDHAIKKI